MVSAALAMGLAVAGAVAPLTSAGAWPGDPDGTFGRCGHQVLDVVAGEASSARAAALQADGKVLVAGSAGDRGLVMRLIGSTYDATFGTAGRTRIMVTGTARYNAVAPTAAGGVVAAGGRVNGTATDTMIVRLKNNGTVDPTFHSTGRLMVDMGGTDAARAVVSLNDGSVLVAGDATAGGYVAHYTNAGLPNTGWDGDGRRTALPMIVRSLVAQADGSVYVGGSTPSSPADWRIMRLNADGSTDTAFGGTDGLTIDVGGHDAVTAMVLQPDGKVVATGFGKGAAGHGQTLVRRYLANGTADPAFTSYRDAFGVNDSPAAITRQSNGSLVIVGNSRVGSDNDLVLVRLGDDGLPDDGFGIDGATVVDAGRRSAAFSVVVPADGRVLAFGTARRAGLDVASAFRFQGNASTAPVPVQGVVVDAFGGLHGWSAGCAAAPNGFVGGPYWPGWDIVRGVAVLPGNRGLVVDAYGGTHGFSFGESPGATPPTHGTPYWPGWDIVRGVVVLPDGTGGYELDGFGGLHPFSIGSGATPAVPAGVPYWSGLDIARGVALMPDGVGGYEVDASGRIYAFGGAPAPNVRGPRWAGQDVARGIALSSDGSGGWIVDYSGGLHPFGTGGDRVPPAAIGGPYWPGASLARGVAVLP